MPDGLFEIRLAANAQELIKNLRAAQEAWAAFAGRLQENQGALWNTTVLGFQLAAGGRVLTGTLSEAAKAADQFRIRMLALEQAAFNTGTSFAEINQAITQLSRDLAVAPEQIAGAFSMLLRRGYEIDQVAEMIRRFADAAVNIGKPIDEGILKGAQAVAQELSRLLNEIGIPENVSDAFRDLAANLGVSVNALTDSQRRAAIFNLVMQSTADKVGLSNVALGGFIGSLQRLRLEWSIFNRDFGVGVASAFIPFIEGARMALSVLNALPEGFRRAIGFATGLSAVLTLLGGLAFLAISNTQRFLATISGTLSAAISSVREFVDVFRNARLAMDAARAFLVQLGATSQLIGALNTQFSTLRRQIATMEAVRPIVDKGAVATFIPPVDFKKLIKKVRVPVVLEFAPLQSVDVFITRLSALSSVAQGPVKQSLRTIEEEMTTLASSLGIAAAGAAGFGEALKLALSGKLGREDTLRVLSTFERLKQALTEIQKSALPATIAALNLREATQIVQRLNALNATMSRLGLSLERLPPPTAEAMEAMKALGLSLENPIVGFNRLVNLVSSGALNDPFLARQAQIAAKYYASLGRELDALKRTRFWGALVDDAAFARFKASRDEAIKLVDDIAARFVEMTTLTSVGGRAIPGAIRARLAGLQVVAKEVEELAQRINEAIRRSAPSGELLALWGAYARTISAAIQEAQAAFRRAKQSKDADLAAFFEAQLENLFALLRDTENAIGEAAQSFGTAILPFPDTPAQQRTLRRFVEEYTAAIGAIIPTLNARIKNAVGQIDIGELPAEMTRKALVDMRQAVVEAVQALGAVLPATTLFRAEKLLPISVDELEDAVRRVFAPAGVKASLIFTESFQQELASGKRLFSPEVLLGALMGIELLAERLDGTKERVIIDLEEIAKEARIAPERAAAALTNLFAYVDKAADKLVLAQSRALYGMNTVASAFVGGLSRILNFVGLSELAKRLQEAFDADLLALYAAQARAAESASRRAFRGISAELALLAAQAKNTASALLFATGPRGAARQGGFFSNLAGGFAAAIGAVAAGAGRLSAIVGALARNLISGLGQALVIVSTLARTLGGALVGLVALIVGSPLFRAAFFNAVAGAVALLVGAFKGLFNALAAGVTYIKGFVGGVASAIPGINLLGEALNRLKAGLVGLGDLLKIAGTELELLGKRARLAALRAIPEGRRSLGQELSIRLLERDIARLETRTESLIRKLDLMWRSFTLPRNIDVEKGLIAQFDQLRAAVDGVEEGLQKGAIGAREADSSYEALSKKVKELSDEVARLQEQYRIPGAQNFLAALKAIQGEIDRARERLSPFIEELRRFEDEVRQLELKVVIEGTPEARRDIAQLALDLEKALQAVNDSSMTPADKAAIANRYRELFGELNRIAQEEFVYNFNRTLQQGQLEIDRTLSELILAPMGQIREEMRLEIARTNQEFDDLIRRYGKDTLEGFQLEVQRQRQIEAIRKVYLQRLADQAAEEQRILRELRITIGRELLSLKEEYISSYQSIADTLRRIAELNTAIDLTRLGVSLRQGITFGKLFPEEAEVQKARLELERTVQALEEYAARVRATFDMRRGALFAEWQLALDEAHNDVINRLRDIERQISDPAELAEARARIIQAYQDKVASIQRNYNLKLVNLEQELNAQLLEINQRRVQTQAALSEAELSRLEASYRRRVESIATLAQTLVQVGDFSFRFTNAAPSIDALVGAMRMLRNEALVLGHSSRVPADALRAIREEADRLAETLISRLADGVRGAIDAMRALGDAVRDAMNRMAELRGDRAGALLSNIQESDLPVEAIRNLKLAVEEATTAVSGLGQAFDNALRAAALDKVAQQSEAILALGKTYDDAKRRVSELGNMIRSFGLTTPKDIQAAAESVDKYAAYLERLKEKYVEAQRAFAASPGDAQLQRRLEDIQNEIARTEAAIAKGLAAREYLDLQRSLAGVTQEISKLSQNLGLAGPELIRLKAELELTALETNYLNKQTEILNSNLSEEAKNLQLAQLAAEYAAKRLAILAERNKELAAVNAILPQDEREVAEATLQSTQARQEATKVARGYVESLYNIVRAANDLKRAELEYAEAQQEVAVIQARLEKGSVAAAQEEVKLAALRRESAAKRLELAQEELRVAASDSERASTLREVAQATKETAEANLAYQESLVKLWKAQDAARARSERLARLALVFFGINYTDTVYEAASAIDTLSDKMARLGQATGEVREQLLDEFIQDLERATELYNRLAMEAADAVMTLGEVVTSSMRLQGFGELMAQLHGAIAMATRFVNAVRQVDFRFIDPSTLQSLHRQGLQIVEQVSNALRGYDEIATKLTGFLETPFAPFVGGALESGLFTLKEIAELWEKQNDLAAQYAGTLNKVKLAYIDIANQANEFLLRSVSAIESLKVDRLLQAPIDRAIERFRALTSSIDDQTRLVEERLDFFATVLGNLARDPEALAAALDQVVSAYAKLGELDQERFQAQFALAQAYASQAEQAKRLVQLLDSQVRSLREISAQIGERLGGRRNRSEEIEALRREIDRIVASVRAAGGVLGDELIDPLTEKVKRLLDLTGSRPLSGFTRFVLEDARALIEEAAKLREGAASSLAYTAGRWQRESLRLAEGVMNMADLGAAFTRLPVEIGPAVAAIDEVVAAMNRLYGVATVLGDALFSLGDLLVERLEGQLSASMDALSGLGVAIDPATRKVVPPEAMDIEKLGALITESISDGVAGLRELPSLIVKSLNDNLGLSFQGLFSSSLLPIVENAFVSSLQKTALKLDPQQLAMLYREPLELTLAPSDLEAFKRTFIEALTAATAVRPNVVLDAKISNNVNLESLGADLYERITRELIRELRNRGLIP